MRIRKNAKFSSLSVSHGLGVDVHPQPHFCQLNQSPWDVIPFSPEIYHQSSIHQFDRENRLDRSGSADGSVHTVEREVEAATQKKAEANNDIERNKKENGDIKIESEFKWDNGKSNADGNGRRDCKKQQEQEISDDNSAIKKSQKDVVGVRRSRARAAKKARYLSSNMQEFYYYSGFGPLWGKKGD